MANIVPGRRDRAPALFSPSPFADARPFASLQHEMNRLFDDALTGHWPIGPFARGDNGFSFPSIEVSETDAEVKVSAELPGLEAKDVEISVDDDILTITGEKRTEIDDKERRYSERAYGRFERRMALPAAVDDERAKAAFKNGVLTVTLPKAEGEKAKAKRIPIG